APASPAAGASPPPPAPPRSRGVTTGTAAHIARDIARAMQAAHDAGVVHRDLKPSNVLLDRAGRIKVMDFGLAKVADRGSTLATASGALLGTPCYMSPEQAAGRLRAVGPRSDVYQIGCMLYEMLTGERPFDGDSAMAVLALVLKEEPTPPRARNPHIGRDVETVCLKAMDKDPARRYASAAELADDLDRYLNGEAVAARPAGAARRLWLWSRRHRAAAVAAASISATLLVTAGAWWLRTGTLNLRVQPPGAQVVLGARSWRIPESGELPIELAAGAYGVRLEMPDHEAETRDVVVRRGETKDLTVTLRHETGLLEAGCDPLGSELEIDGVAYGSRVHNLSLPTGAHQVIAGGDGLIEKRLDFTLARGRRFRAYFSLDAGTVWHYSSSGIPQGPRLPWFYPDLDGDGRAEVLHQDACDLVVRSSRTGKELSRVPAGRTIRFNYGPTRGPAAAEARLLSAREETGGLEVTLFDPRRTGTAAIEWRHVESERSWPHATAAAYVAVDDLDGDGIGEIAVAVRDPGLRVLDGRTGETRATLPYPVYPLVVGRASERSGDALLVIGKACGATEDPSFLNLAGPAVVGRVAVAERRLVWSRELPEAELFELSDLDGDGEKEIRWCGHGTAGVLDGATGAVRWTWTYPGGGRDRMTNAVADLDGDTTPDMILQTAGGALTALAGADQRVLWERPEGTAAAGYAVGGPRGRALAVVASETALTALDGADGTVRWTVPGSWRYPRFLQWDGGDEPELFALRLADPGDEETAGQKRFRLACFDLSGRLLWAYGSTRDLYPVDTLPDVDGDGMDELLVHGGMSMVGVVRGPRFLWARRASKPLLATPLVLDTDGDGRAEVIQLGAWSAVEDLACLEGSDGSIRWTARDLFTPNRGPGVGDLDRDGLPDVVLCGRRRESIDPLLEVLRARDGTVLARWPHDGRKVYSAPALADLNGDGTPDPCFHRWDRQDVVALDGVTGATLWRHAAGAVAMGGVGVADLDADGRPDVLAPFMNGAVWALRGRDGSVLWQAQLEPDGTRGAPTFADLGGDGVPEVLLVSRQGSLWVLDGRTGKSLWRVQGTLDPVGRPAVARRADGGTVLLAGLGQAGVGAFDWERRRVLWQAPAGQAVIASPVVADLDRDGKSEVVIATVRGELVVVDLEDGHELWRCPVEEGATPLIEADPAVGDLNGDGVLDVVVADHGGGLRAIDGRATLGARRRAK
ncbi:MAG: PQQ-binding-like beta-propeller repeat protein, partial [Planctomycetes bacterium]|nr:PQQ-binding-like beta-propeller repeat protein [Planctomycetota bacterium]